MGGLPVHVFYTSAPERVRADCERAYGPRWWRWNDVRYSDPVDWSWDEERWLRDPVYHAAVTVLLRWMAWGGLGALRFTGAR